VEAIGELDCYVAGEPAGALRAAIVVMYDVYGLNGGHARGVCDELAAAGYYVVMPDFFRGGTIEPFYRAGEPQRGKQWLRQFDWACVGAHLSAVHEHLRSLGIGRVGSIGFCWGAWAVAKACQDPTKVQAGVWCHPSCQVARELYEGETEAELAGALRAPTLVMTGRNDPEIYRDGSLTGVMARNGVPGEAVHFEDMVHGWVTRGAGFLGRDWSATSCLPETDPRVQRDVRRALQLAAGWFAKHLFA